MLCAGGILVHRCRETLVHRCTGALVQEHGKIMKKEIVYGNRNSNRKCVVPTISIYFFYYYF